MALELESEADEHLRSAARDQLLPTVSALGAIGDTPIGDSQLASWYGAVGVNVQIPVFNGFLFTAKTHEATLRAQARKQQILATPLTSAWTSAPSC